MSLHKLGLLIGAFVVAAGAPAHAEPIWSFSTGADYTSGKYGETVDTNILIVPFAATYSAERWQFGVTVPYVQLDGSGNVIPGTGAGNGDVLNTASAGMLTTPGLLGSNPFAPPAPTPSRIQEQGLGDVTLSLAATPYLASSGARLTLSTDLRTPTGDAKRSLGAGQAVGAFTIGYAQPFGGRFDVYGSVGYQRAFKSNADSLTATFGAETQATNRVLLGASAAWAQASVDGRPNQTELSVYSGVDFNDHVRVAAYVLGGLTKSSPDIGAGLRLVLKP
ncbi:MAG: hypothetical protein ABUS57_00530 [Pseudomonadota bacterium]